MYYRISVGNSEVYSVAFAMRIDIPNIHTVLHLGPPSDLDCYVPESGHIDLRYANKSMRSYCINLQCLRLVKMGSLRNVL